MQNIDKKNPFEAIFLKGWHPYAWIILIALLVYYNAPSFGFSYLDDNILILENYLFLNDLSNIPRAFIQDVFYVLHEYAAGYRPILTISFILDSQFGIASGVIYHLTNIFIHLLASCLVFVFFIRLRYRQTPSFLFSIIFAVHPVLVQTVVWIPGRNDSLLAVFILSSFIFFSYFAETKQRIYYVFHMGVWALALFTKETALVFIAICILYSGFILKEKTFLFNRNILAIGWFFIILIWFLLRKTALSYNPINLSAINIAKDLIYGSPALLFYAGKAIFPFNLSVIPTIEDTAISYGIIAVILIATGLIFSKNKRYNIVFWGAAWFILFLIPTFLRPRPDNPAIFLESRIYLPIIGLFIILLEIDLIKNIRFNKRLVPVCILTILIVFSQINIKYSLNFRNKLAFWESAVKESPHSPLAHQNLGYVYSLEGALEKAEENFRKALKLNPRQKYVYNSLGLIYAGKGLLEEAEFEYRKELEMNPDFDKAYFNLASLYFAQGKLKEAEKLWEKTLEVNPNNIAARKNLSIYYFEEKHFEKALYHVSELQKRGQDIPETFLKELHKKTAAY